MKTKVKKLLLRVFAVMLALYVFAGAFLILTQHKNEFDYFIDSSENMLSSLTGINNYYQSKTFKTDFLSATDMEFPIACALLDSEGNVLASSRPAFTVYFNGTNNALDGEIFIDSYSYTTDETHRQIIDFVENCSVYCNLQAEYLSVYKDGEIYIPVSAVLYNSQSADDGKITVHFTDYEPTFTFKEGNGISVYLNGYGYIDSRIDAKLFFSLNKELDDFIGSFPETHKNFEAYDFLHSHPYKLVGSNSVEHEKHFVLGGPENRAQLCLYNKTETNLYYNAVKHCPMLIYMGIMFFFAALMIAFVLIRVERKNEKLAQSRRAFVAAAAHELKTPLAVIANKSECILENVSPEQTAEYVNSIYDESKRMSRMVKTLLQYNKLNNDTVITKNKEKLAPIIAEQTAKFKPLIDAKNITLTETVNENALLECNKELLGIAIDNLLSNAVKFTDENGEIRITATASGRNFSFEIFNSGSSVSSEDAPHIWEELYSGDKARTRSDSSGMGLAICKRIFTLHGFTYGCRNETDGVTFYFSAHR